MRAVADSETSWRDRTRDAIWDSMRSQTTTVLLTEFERHARARARWRGAHWRLRRAVSAVLFWVSYHPALLVLLAGAVLWFVGLYVDPVMQANMHGELWGVAGAGLAVWLVQELLSEDIQRRAWLRRNVGYV